MKRSILGYPRALLNPNRCFVKISIFVIQNPDTHGVCGYNDAYMAMDQYLLIPFLGGWTSIYQLFWCSPGVQGFDTLPYDHRLVYSRLISSNPNLMAPSKSEGFFPQRSAPLWLLPPRWWQPWRLRKWNAWWCCLAPWWDAEVDVKTRVTVWFDSYPIANSYIHGHSS